MATVSGYLRSADTYVWQKVEDCSSRAPYLARLTTIPVTVYTIARDILEGPGICIEECILFLEGLRRPWRFGDAAIEHVLYAVGNGTYTAISPLVALVDAVASCVKIGISPLKTAKINLARQQVLAYCDKLSPREGRMTRQRYCDIACNKEIKMEFALADWEFFKRRVWAARSNDELRALQFPCDTEFEARVDAKYQKYKAVHELYWSNNPAIQSALDIFKKQIMDTSLEELHRITFELPVA